jgi:hypothetical protein
MWIISQVLDKMRIGAESPNYQLQQLWDQYYGKAHQSYLITNFLAS